MARALCSCNLVAGEIPAELIVKVLLMSLERKEKKEELLNDCVKYFELKLHKMKQIQWKIWFKKTLSSNEMSYNRAA